MQLHYLAVAVIQTLEDFSYKVELRLMALLLLEHLWIMVAISEQHVAAM